MNKGGFTLIELLAVIVILAILVLITIPIVLNIIENANKNSAKISAKKYIDSIELLIANKKSEGIDISNSSNYIIDESGNLVLNDINYEVEVTGNKPTGNYVKIEELQIKEAEMIIKGYKFKYNGKVLESIDKIEGEYESSGVNETVDAIKYLPNNSMAHNIYSNPDLSNTSGYFDTFIIDFRGIKTPTGTYWALCNWKMDLASFDAETGHDDVTGGGAYAGLQNTINGKVAIMSFWEINYTTVIDGKSVNKKITANRVYPAGNDNPFGGEGNGNNYITKFNWDTNKWYKMVIHSWNDIDTNKTFVGQWFQDIANNKWYLISYFNTNLNNSRMTGALSQFQENYDSRYAALLREFNIKNMYVKDSVKNKWVSLNKTTLLYDDSEWGYNTSWSHEFGYTDEYFYGKAGEFVENQEEYDQRTPKNLSATISQVAEPVFNSLLIKSFDANINNNSISFSWALKDNSTPQLSYKIDIINKSSNEIIASISKSRPEETTNTYQITNGDLYKFKLTITDIFNQSTSILINE